MNGKHTDNINNSLVAEVLIDKSKGHPEFKLKCHTKKEQEHPLETNIQYRTPYLVVKEFSKNGINTGYPLRTNYFIQAPATSSS